jgi:hypothetical protein
VNNSTGAGRQVLDQTPKSWNFSQLPTAVRLAINGEAPPASAVT